jgi:hypothetical protein
MVWTFTDFMAKSTTQVRRDPPRRSEGKRTTSIVWSDSILEDIDLLAKANKRSRSAQIEYLLEKYVPAEKRLAGI